MTPWGVDGVNGAVDSLDEFGRGTDVERPFLAVLAQRAAFEEFDGQVRDRTPPRNVLHSDLHHLGC